MDIKEGLSSKKLVVNVKQGMKLESDECNTSTNCNPKAKISLPGIRRQKNGRYGVELTDPIRHKRVWVGTFDTVKEASQAYSSKKSEFENEKLRQQGNKKSKRIRKTIGIVEVHKRGKYNSKKSEELVNVKQENENVNREIFQTESAGGSEIDIPISNSSNGGTEKRIDLHEIGAVEEAFRIAKEGSRVFKMANVCGTKSSDDCNKPTSCNPEVKVSLIGTRKQKNGRYAAVITDPFTHKRVRLGTFDTVEEASQAYFSKKSEFEKLSQQGNKQNILKKKNCDQIQQLESSSVVVASLDTTASESGRARRIHSHKKKTHLIGAHKSTKKGRYQSEIKNPITKKRIWLGTFGTAEEASHAYQSKKLEFQKLVEAKQQQCTYKQLKSEKLVNLKQGHENVKCEPFQPESSPDIDIPFSNSSNGGTVQSIDPNKIGNQSKKFDLELESNMPIGSSAGEKQGQEDDEDSWKGEWVQLPGDNRAVMFSLKLGLPIIDNYGYLLGEFSTLDDLSICKTEEGNNYISHSI